MTNPNVYFSQDHCHPYPISQGPVMVRMGRNALIQQKQKQKRKTKKSLSREYASSPSKILVPLHWYNLWHHSSLAGAVNLRSQPAPRWEGGKTPPYSFLPIAKKRREISPPNFAYLLPNRFHTPWLKKFYKALIGRPLMTSEWRHVFPISFKNKSAWESSSRVQL